MLIEPQLDCSKIMHYALVNNSILEFRNDNSIGVIGLDDYKYRSKETDAISFLGFDYASGCLMHLSKQKLVLTLYEDYSDLAVSVR